MDKLCCLWNFPESLYTYVYQYRHIYTYTLKSDCVYEYAHTYLLIRSVTVLVAGNGEDESSSNPKRGNLRLSLC